MLLRVQELASSGLFSFCSTWLDFDLLQPGEEGVRGQMGGDGLVVDEELIATTYGLQKCAATELDDFLVFGPFTNCPGSTRTPRIGIKGPL